MISFMAKNVRVSLANKCQLLFGAAVVLILTSALAVVWWRMQKLVREGQQQVSKQISDDHIDMMILESLDARPIDSGRNAIARDLRNGINLTLLQRDQLAAAARTNPFLRDALKYFGGRKGRRKFFGPLDEDGHRFYGYARAIHQVRITRLLKHGDDDLHAAAGPSPQANIAPNRMEMVLLVRIPSDEAEKQLMLNRIYIVTAGLLAGLLAIAVFWYITMRIVLSPVRVLRSYAEKVSEGDLNIRSDINTGDEFEQLSDIFNTMLENLKSQADQLKSTNKSLDLKLGELAESNVALYEADKIKGEFLANVSHELRTPLNSIIGFAEVLDETLSRSDDPMAPKRRRYISNIISSSRRLLDLINDLLDLAKIEAGRMDLHVVPMSVQDTAEGLINLVRPQAAKRSIELRLKIPPNLPMVQTDAGKVQQILFNFLSNAVKFTPTGGSVTMSAQVLGPAPGKDHPDRGNGQSPQAMRISISDTGPGIATEDHQRIFEKFTQLDPSVTKEHGGTGLGLTISHDLSRLLQGRIEIDSELGRGATFSLLVPLALPSQSAPLMPEGMGSGV